MWLSLATFHLALQFADKLLLIVTSTIVSCRTHVFSCATSQTSLMGHSQLSAAATAQLALHLIVLLTYSTPLSPVDVGTTITTTYVTLLVHLVHRTRLTAQGEGKDKKYK